MLDLATSAGDASTCCSTRRHRRNPAAASSSARTNGTACWRSTWRGRLFCLASRRQRMRCAGADCRFGSARKVDQTASIAAYRGGPGVHAPLCGQQGRRRQRHAHRVQVLAADRITSNCICPGAVDTADVEEDRCANGGKIEGWQNGEAWKRRTSFIPLGGPKLPTTWLAS